MGLDLSGFDHIITHKNYVKGNCLQIGRQGLHYAGPWFDPYGQKTFISNEILRKNGITFSAEETVFGSSGYTEKLFRMLGADTVDSLDNSSFENASIIHDLNLPIPGNFINKYDCILDCGTIEHIFDVKTVIENIKNMLKINGVFLIVTPCNNFPGHGFYQFSPEFFRTVFSKKAGYETLGATLYEVEPGIGNFNKLPVPSPKEGERQEFQTSNKPHYFAFSCKKIMHIKNMHYQQSDYVAAWNN